METGTALTKDDFAERITAAQLQAGMVHVSQTIETDGATTTTEGAMTVTADIGSARVAMTSSGPTGSNEVRIVDGVMYMNLGELSQNMFMVIDGSDSALMDPTEIMRLLDEAAVSYQGVLTKADKINAYELEAVALASEVGLQLPGGGVQHGVAVGRNGVASGQPGGQVALVLEPQAAQALGGGRQQQRAQRAVDAGHGLGAAGDLGWGGCHVGVSLGAVSPPCQAHITA